MNKKQQLKRTFKASFLIATIIFTTAVLSDIALKFFYLGEGLPIEYSIPVGVLFSTIGTFIITGLLMVLFWNSPRIEKAFSGIFEDDRTNEKKE
jgi:hypothetical protein